MLYELYPSQPELLTRLTLRLELCLKRNEWVVSGALKEHQATRPLNALGVGRYHVIPWVVVGPVVERQIRRGRGLQESRPFSRLGFRVRAPVGRGTLLSALFLWMFEFVTFTRCGAPGADTSAWC